MKLGSEFKEHAFLATQTPSSVSEELPYGNQPIGGEFTERLGGAKRRGNDTRQHPQ